MVSWTSCLTKAENIRPFIGWGLGVSHRQVVTDIPFQDPTLHALLMLTYVEVLLSFLTNNVTSSLWRAKCMGLLIPSPLSLLLTTQAHTDCPLLPTLRLQSLYHWPNAHNCALHYCCKPQACRRVCEVFCYPCINLRCPIIPIPKSPMVSASTSFFQKNMPAMMHFSCSHSLPGWAERPASLGCH